MIDHCPPGTPSSEKKILTFQWEVDGQVYMETHLFLVTTPMDQIRNKSACPHVCKNHTPDSGQMSEEPGV